MRKNFAVAGGLSLALAVSPVLSTATVAFAEDSAAETKTTKPVQVTRKVTPQTGDAAIAVSGVAASGVLALLGSVLARRKKQD